MQLKLNHVIFTQIEDDTNIALKFPRKAISMVQLIGNEIDVEIQVHHKTHHVRFRIEETGPNLYEHCIMMLTESVAIQVSLLTVNIHNCSQQEYKLKNRTKEQKEDDTDIGAVIKFHQRIKRLARIGYQTICVKQAGQILDSCTKMLDAMYQLEEKQRILLMDDVKVAEKLCTTMQKMQRKGKQVHKCDDKSECT